MSMKDKLHEEIDFPSFTFVLMHYFVHMKAVCKHYEGYPTIYEIR